MESHDQTQRHYLKWDKLREEEEEEECAKSQNFETMYKYKSRKYKIS